MKKSFFAYIFTLLIVFLLGNSGFVLASGYGSPVGIGNWQLSYSYNYETHICYSHEFNLSGSSPACDSYALDFVPLSTGKDIIAIESGTIILKRLQSPYGNTVIIDHGNGIYSRYAHLANFDANLGMVVTRGTKLGIAGNTTGNGSYVGVHLHFVMYKVNNTYTTAYKSEPLGGLSNFPSGYANVYLSSNGSTLSCYLNCGNINEELATDIRFSSSITVNPNPMVQGSSAIVGVRIANNATTTFQGQISAAVYRVNGEEIIPMGDIAAVKSVSIPSGYAQYYSFENSALQIPPGNYWLRIEHDSGNDNWQAIPAGSYQNPIPIEIKGAGPSLSLSSPITVDPLLRGGRANVSITLNNSSNITFQEQVRVVLYNFMGYWETIQQGQVTINAGSTASYIFTKAILEASPGDYQLKVSYMKNGYWNDFPVSGDAINPISVHVNPGINNTENYSWHGNGSIISYHGRLISDSTGLVDFPYGITQDTVQLHSSSSNPVGFFQWQINTNGCSRLKLDVPSLSSSAKKVDLTIGNWSTRDDDITFSDVTLPFVLGSSNTNFSMSNGNWFVVKAAFKNRLSEDARLDATCTTNSPTYATYSAGGGSAVIMDNGYKWNGNASIISHLFNDLRYRSTSSSDVDWPYGAFQDVLYVRPSSEKPMVFFQWQRDSVCSQLTLDAPDLSYSEKLVDIHLKHWSTASNQATVLSGRRLPLTVNSIESRDGTWTLVQIKFLNPVSTASRIEATCPGFN